MIENIKIRLTSIKLYAVILINFIIVSCQSQIIINGFDISPDDKLILYCLKTENVSSIHVIDIEKGEDVVLKESSNKLYVNPKFSIKGNEVLFIEFDKGQLNSSIGIIDIHNNEDVQYLIRDKFMITEAIFSKYSNEIIYCKAAEYQKYSPLKSASSHKYEIYSISNDTKKIKQISELNSYSLHHIFEVDSNTIMFTLFEGNKGGMCVLKKQTPSVYSRIVPVNNPRGYADLYSQPIYSPKYNKLAFVAPFQIYVMDEISQKATILLDNVGKEQIDYVSFFNNDAKIAFVLEGKPCLYTINLDGRELSKIPLSECK